MRATEVSSLFSIVTMFMMGWAERAEAAPQAPHDVAHNVTCNSCHIPYGGTGAHTYSGSATGAGTTTSLTDSSQSWSANQWQGGVVTFLSGANQWQFRTVTASSVNGLRWTDPLPNAVAASDTYTLDKVTYDDVALKCQACHNPTGQASAKPDGAVHFTDTGEVGCGKCHEPHNLLPNSGWSGSGAGQGNLIREQIQHPKTGVMMTSSYDPTQPEATRLINASGTGICQMCHTETAVFANGQTPPGSAQHHSYADPVAAPQGCTTVGCHNHNTSFNTATTGEHFDKSAAAWGTAPGSQACWRCHTSGGYQDYIGADGTPDNHLSGTFLVDTTIQPAIGGLECKTCHNAAADALNSVMFVSGFQYTGLDKRLAICAQCHQGRESTISVSRKFAILDQDNASPPNNIDFTATGAADPPFTINPTQPLPLPLPPPAPFNNTTGTTLTANPKTAWTANAYKGYFALFTAGPNLGQYRSIAGNTSNTLTFTTPLPADVTAGEKFVIVNSTTTGAGALDTQVSQSFTNSHYLAAAAIFFGRDAKVAFEYMNPGTLVNSGAPQVTANTSGKANNVADPPGAASYSPRNPHGLNAGDCTSCHNQHTLQIKWTYCSNCHVYASASDPVQAQSDMETKWQYGFWGDIDGDGVDEGPKAEVVGHLDANGNRTGTYPDGILDVLLAAIKRYANYKNGTAICYTSASYPYWFYDNGAGGGTANNGICETGEQASANAYKKWTPRLLHAAFNYNLIMREPGAWAHNPRYVVELAYDGIVDLDSQLANNASCGSVQKVGGNCTAGGSSSTWTFTVKRSFGEIVSYNSDGTFGSVLPSHFDAAGGAFQRTNFDGGGAAPYPCLRCHGGQAGYEAFWSSANPFDQTAPELRNGFTPALGMQCFTCHTPQPGDTDMKRLRDVSSNVAGGVRVPGHWAGGTLGSKASVVVLDASHFDDPKSMICASCHQSRDFNGTALDQYLDGVWSAIDVPGSPFIGGEASLVAGANGNVRITGLPLYQGPGNWGTPNNWLYNPYVVSNAGTTTPANAATNCLMGPAPFYKYTAIGASSATYVAPVDAKWITISGAANAAYNGTFQVVTCADGTADLNLPYTADDLNNANISWSVSAAGTKNFHDIQGGANVWGSAAHVGYEYAGETYAGLAQHGGKKADCIGCHQPKTTGHTMRASDAAAAGGCVGGGCHADNNYGNYFNAARALTTTNGYDGNPATTTLAGEIGSFVTALAAAMNSYQRAHGYTAVAQKLVTTCVAPLKAGQCASDFVSGANICWDLTRQGWYAEVGNTSGLCAAAPNAPLRSWTGFDPKMSRAAYNISFQNAGNDPGYWAHNFDYVAELLYDSIVDLGGNTSGLTRP